MLFVEGDQRHHALRQLPDRVPKLIKRHSTPKDHSVAPRGESVNQSVAGALVGAQGPHLWMGRGVGKGLPVARARVGAGGASLRECTGNGS